MVGGEARADGAGGQLITDGMKREYGACQRVCARHASGAMGDIGWIGFTALGCVCMLSDFRQQEQRMHLFDSLAVLGSSSQD